MRGTQFSHLTAFVAVADHRSFTKAASYLGIKVPSLSHAVRTLEDQLGVRLLNRTTRSVALTPAGERLRSHLDPVLDGVDNAIEAMNEFRDSPSGKLRLSVHPVAAINILAPLVGRFSAQNPAVRLEISVDAEPKDIVTERYDAGIHFSDCIDRDMIAFPVSGNLRFLTVAAPAYLAKRQLPQLPEDLRSHNCIRYRWGREDLPWRFSTSKQQAEVEVEVAGSLTVNDLDLGLQSALDGVGIIQLPEALIAPYLADGRLVLTLSEWRSCWSSFCLYYSSRRHVPMALRNLIEFLRRESRSANPRRLTVVPHVDDLTRRVTPAPDFRHHDSFRRNTPLVAAISTKSLSIAHDI
jgi:DNA-binding transcriptional LysR family regulator